MLESCIIETFYTDGNRYYHAAAILALSRGARGSTAVCRECAIGDGKEAGHAAEPPGLEEQQLLKQHSSCAD